MFYEKRPARPDAVLAPGFRNRSFRQETIGELNRQTSRSLLLPHLYDRNAEVEFLGKKRHVPCRRSSQEVKIPISQASL